MAPKRGPKQIAPRLANGEKRGHHGLPPTVSHAFRMIAVRDNKSMSWIRENLIISAYGLKRPEYLKRKEAK